MHGAFGQFIISVVMVGGFGFGLLHQFAKVREAGGRRQPGGRRMQSAMGAAAHPRKAARAAVREARGKAKATDWLERQRHHRANGQPGEPSRFARAGSAARSAARSVRRDRPPATVPGTVVTEPSPPPPPKPSTAGGNTTMPASNGSAGSSGAAEQMIQGINQIHASASAGNIITKQQAIKSATEGALRFAGMSAMLARELSERNYGPEITEPLAKAAEHAQAVAMSLGESDTNLTTLINMSVGDLAASARQAPHHSELSETGAH